LLVAGAGKNAASIKSSGSRHGDDRHEGFFPMAPCSQFCIKSKIQYCCTNVIAAIIICSPAAMCRIAIA